MRYDDGDDVVVVDTLTMKEIERISVGERICAIGVCRTGRYLTVACVDINCRIVDLLRRRDVVMLRGHDAFAFEPWSDPGILAGPYIEPGG